MAIFFRDIGINGNERRRKLKRIGEVAENASRSIWGWSHFKNWGIGVTTEYQCRYGVEYLKGAGGTCLANVLVLPPKTYSG